ncbi:MAG: DHH family phosphoesterase, partial [Patescibacteria group bacterium]
VKQVKYHKEDNALNFIISPEKGFFTASDISSRAGEFKYDLIITVGTPDLESLGKIYDDNTEFFYQVPIINIDHQSNNEEFGQINYVELKAVATSEILFSLFENYSRELIDEDVATCLLAGIIYQTKSFKTTNITPQTLLITSQLISMGGRREEIVNKFYRSRNLNVLKLWGRVLARLSSSSDNQLIWSTLSSVDFIKTEAKEEDLSDVIDELIINIPQAKIVLIIYEKKKKPEEEAISATEPQTKISIYSVKNINLLDLAKEYNPVGTKKLISLTFKKGLVETEKEIINFIKDKLSKLDL